MCQTPEKDGERDLEVVVLILTVFNGMRVFNDKSVTSKK